MEISITPPIEQSHSVQFEEDHVPTRRGSSCKIVAKACSGSSYIPRFIATLTSVALVGVWIIKSNFEMLDKLQTNIDGANAGCNFNATCFNAASHSIFDASGAEQTYILNNAVWILLASVPALLTTVSAFDLRSGEHNSKPLRITHFVFGASAFAAGMATSTVFPISGPLLAFSGAWTAINSMA